MPNKLTDAEIKKALEELRANLDDGYSTALMWGGKRDIEAEKAIDLYGAVLDLINRLQGKLDFMTEQRDGYMQDATDFSQENDRLKAEIERLRAECGNQSTLWSKHFESIFETAKETVKSEARKEFAERLHEYINGIIERHEMPMFPFSIAFVSGIETKIDNLLKERESDDK